MIDKEGAPTPPLSSPWWRLRQLEGRSKIEKASEEETAEKKGRGKGRHGSCTAALGLRDTAKRRLLLLGQEVWGIIKAKDSGGGPTGKEESPPLYSGHHLSTITVGEEYEWGGDRGWGIMIAVLLSSKLRP